MMTLLPLLLFIFTICLLAAFIALQIYLSRKPSKWPGRILPIAGFTVAVLISFSLLTYIVFPGSYDAVGDGEIALGTDDVEISIYTQEKENHILFSDARVTNLQNGAVTECPLEFSDSGKLIGGGEALNYKADIEDLADGNFTGKSITIDAMRESSHSSLPLNTLFLLLFLFIPPFILTFLHIYIRKKMRRAQYETDLEKMKIEDLS